MSVIVQSIVKITVFFALLSSLIACGGAPAGGSGSSSGITSGDGEATITFNSASESQLVLKGRGGVENSIISFVVRDASGTSLSNQSVTFSLSTDAGGVEFVSNSSVSSDASGNASVIVQSGNVPIAVQVIATLNGGAVRAVSNEIQISTSIFTAGNFSVGPNSSDVDGENAGADIAPSAGVIGNTQVGLVAIASDQFGHAVLEGSRVTFVSPETGIIDPATCEMDSGSCTTNWRSSGNTGVGFRATILAYASGAEFFEDLNSNNIYEVGEPFVDLPEVYADENENGVYDVGEFFLDQNDDGVYDAVGNGVWDGPCVLIEGEDEAALNERCAGLVSTAISDSFVLYLGAEPEEETGG